MKRYTTKELIDIAKEHEVVGTIPEIWIRAQKGNISEVSNREGCLEHDLDWPYINDKETTTDWMGLRVSFGTLIYYYGLEREKNEINRLEV